MRPTYAQQEALLSMLETNPLLAKGQGRTTYMRLQQKKFWEDVAAKLNIMKGAVKSPGVWAKYWIDKKAALKKTYMSRTKKASQDDNYDEANNLSPLEWRIIDLVGDSFGFQTEIKHEVQNIEINENDDCGISSYTENNDDDDIQLRIPEDETKLKSKDPLKKLKSQKLQLNAECDRLIAIEERKIEIDLMKAESMKLIASSIENAGKSISESLLKVAESLNNLSHVGTNGGINTGYHGH